MNSKAEQEGLGCLLLIVIALALVMGAWSCCSSETQKRRDHEYRMEQLRLENEGKTK